MDKARYLGISQGSLEECRYYLILAHDLGYGDPSLLGATLEEDFSAPDRLCRQGYALKKSVSPEF